jgi:hypothetical protein
MICRDIILQAIMGSLQIMARAMRKHGIPIALYERPRKRKNLGEIVATALT